MAWYWIVLIVIGAVILTGYLAARAFADYGVKMIISFFKGPGGEDER